MFIFGHIGITLGIFYSLNRLLPKKNIPRITSYNVCYTKLLRVEAGVHEAPEARHEVDRVVHRDAERDGEDQDGGGLQRHAERGHDADDRDEREDVGHERQEA